MIIMILDELIHIKKNEKIIQERQVTESIAM